MPIGTFISQPAVNALQAAYRPVVIRVSATKTDNTPQPPVVYCDIYFNNTYYKTISKTQYALLNINNTEWQFDIQDAAQEFLRKFLTENGESAIVEATTIITRCYCRFRSSGIDVNGFIQNEDTAPVQGTSSNDPVSGSGIESNTFFILNATLQHEDSQDLAIHLTSFKKRTWADSTYPLTHRPDNYFICTDDSDVFPIVHDGNEPTCIKLWYQNKGQSTWNSATNCAVKSCPIPADPVEISVLDNGNGTETFTFNWGTILSPSAQFDIQSRPSGTTDDWTSHIGSITPTRAITLPIGLYDFRFAGVGDCASKPAGYQLNQGIAFCDPVQIISDFTLPDGQVGVLYDFTIYLSGTSPFALANVIKPSWMTLTLFGAQVRIAGTPGVGQNGSNIPVSFDITNCSGNSSVTVDELINVAAPAASTFTNNSGVSFGYKIRINGVIYKAGTVAIGETVSFNAPELSLGSGYELLVYTSTLLMTTCVANSNSVNIPMVIDTGGPGTNNLAKNAATFAIVNGVHITVS